MTGDEIAVERITRVAAHEQMLDQVDGSDWALATLDCDA